MKKIIDMLVRLSVLLVIGWFLIQDLKYDVPFMVTFITFNLFITAFKMALKNI